MKTEEEAMRKIVGGIIGIVGFLFGIGMAIEHSALICMGAMAVGAIIAFVPIKK